MLVDRMRVVRKRHGEATQKPVSARMKRLLTLLCLTALVEHGEAAEFEARDSFDYVFLILCVIAVIAVWEGVKTMVAWLKQCCGSTVRGRRAEELTGPSVSSDGPRCSDSLGDPFVEPTGLRQRRWSPMKERSVLPTPERQEYRSLGRRSATSPVHEPVTAWPSLDVRHFVPPSGKRDYWGD